MKSAQASLALTTDPLVVATVGRYGAAATGGIVRNMAILPTLQDVEAMNVMASTLPQAGVEIFERIMAAPSGLVALDCADLHTLIDQLRAIARHSGQALYLWQPDTGLSSLRDAHARVPDCQRLGNALRYMQQSMHFGVYFLVGLELPLSAMDATLLRQLARQPKEHLRRVVLIDAPASLIEHLGEQAVHLGSEDGRPRRLRLRDGRWMI